MRTQEEILKRLELAKEKDPFGFALTDLLGRLTFEKAKPMLKPEYVADVEAGKEKWEVMPTDRDAIIKEMREYMSFAWDKCTGQRGISASRSVLHYENWLWLIGDHEALAFVEDDDNYPPYGAPCLVYICKRFDFPMPDVEEIARVGGVS